MNIIPQGSGIYLISCASSSKVYVGSSRAIRTRFRTHRNLLAQGNHFNVHLQRAWDAYGHDAFEFTLIEEVSIDQLLIREQFWIDTYRSADVRYGYNISQQAGAPMAGRRHSDKTRKAFSETRRGVNNANYRGPSTICIKCGALFLAHSKRRKYCSLQCYHADPDRMTSEIRAKYGAGSRGKKRSAESLARAFAKRARWFVVTDPSGIEYRIQGLAAFCREHELDQGSMSAVVSGRRQSHKGWKCRRDE